MGLVWRRRKRLGRNTYLNLSKSGPSLSRRIGPLSVSSRRRGSLRLGRGLSWRFKL